MNKNPFAATAAYNPQQPPLPPGPPPPQPAQPDYSAYWAAATAAQHVQPPTVGTYNPQWSAAQSAQPAAPRPTPEQSALYANYGYGGQQNLNWQQQQQRQAQPHFQPPPPVVQPPPPPPQPAYNPYQPQAGVFQQQQQPQYVPQGGPTSQIPQTSFQPQVPPQHFQQPQQQQQFFHPQQQQPRPNNRPPNVQPSPQHFPPAKRQRFDGPIQHRGPVPPQPQFQPPPPPPMMQQNGMGMFGQGQSQGFVHRGGGPGMNPMMNGGSRGGFVPRGGGNPGGRGRGVPLGMNRGGSRGRGNGTYNNMGGRGGSMNQQGGSFRGHGSTRGFGNRDNRRGGFVGGGGQGYSHGYQSQQQPPHHHHQQNYSNNNSFRGRSQSYSHPPRGRHDPGAMNGVRDAGSAVSSSFSSGKKDENRRTLTDFKIIGLEIRELSWSWGLLASESVDTALKVESLETSIPADVAVGPQNPDDPAGDSSAKADVIAGADTVSMDLTQPATDVSVPATDVALKSDAVPLIPPPPSRIRIYFHTPVTADDSHPLASQPSFSLGASSVSNMRKGKRKKLEDDDGDLEEGRGAPPPPPHLSAMGAERDSASVSASMEYDGTETVAGRDSVAPSVAETASEGDWLMAAIGGDEGEGEEAGHQHMNDAEQYHDADMGDGDYGNGYDDMQGDGHEGYHMMGDDDPHGSMEGHHDESAPTAEQGSMSAGSNGPNGVNGAETLSVNGSSGAPPGDADHHQENGFIAPPGAHVVGSANPQDTDHGVPSDLSASHDVSATAGAPSESPSAAISPAEVADGARNVDVQALSEIVTRAVGAPLQAMDSLASTVPDTSAQQTDISPYSSTVIDAESADMTNDQTREATQPAEDYSSYGQGHEDVGEPSASQSTTKVDAKGGKTPSANRLSVSYAAGSRRLVIDAEVVEKLKVTRADGRIEVDMNVSRDELSGFKGILIEVYSEATSSYLPLEISEGAETDPTVPAFSKATLPTKLSLVVHLDRERPLSEPRWVKTGDVQEWLKSMFGRMFWVAGDAADGWERKIEVVDPDPAPTIWTVLEAWAGNSNVGLPVERQRFLRTHMTETDNILEILLRLVRGERSTYSQSTPVISAPSVSGPLLSALSQGSAHGAQQTHVSLAVLAIFRLAVEYAKKAAPDGGKGEVEERVGDIIRSLPSHLIYKSLDGIFKEWRVEKKGGR
ncbi:hypothetical protein B0H21DRAFT_724715 [Amylocystis lapponica]|nr:hypothetical protein B0H21DRAFT_724715 [Amylocystis lapponica]